MLVVLVVDGMLHDAFAALLQSPSALRYKRVRTALLPGLDHSSLGLTLLAHEQALREERMDSRALFALNETALLSLKWHRLAGVVALELGDHRRAQLHRFTFDALATAIRATGKGTRRQPYLVTYTSDAHELIALEGLTVVSQSLVSLNDRRFDVLLLSNEQECWFEVTDITPAPVVVEAAHATPAPVRKRAARARVKVASRSRR